MDVVERSPRRPLDHHPVTGEIGPDRWITMNDVSGAMALTRTTDRTQAIRPLDAMHHDGQSEDRDFTTATGAFFGWRSGLTDQVRYEHGHKDCRIVFGDDAPDYHTMNRQNVPPFAITTGTTAVIRPRTESHAVGGRSSPANFQTTFERDYCLPPVTENRRPLKPQATTSHAVIAHNEESPRDHFLSTAAANFDDKMSRVTSQDRRAVHQIAAFTKQRFARASWPTEGARVAQYQTEITSQFVRKTPISHPDRVSVKTAVNADHLQWGQAPGNYATTTMAGTTSLLNACRAVPVAVAKPPKTESHVLGHGTASMSLTTSSIMSAAYSDPGM